MSLTVSVTSKLSRRTDGIPSVCEPYFSQKFKTQFKNFDPLFGPWLDKEDYVHKVQGGKKSFDEFDGNQIDLDLESILNSRSKIFFFLLYFTQHEDKTFPRNNRSQPSFFEKWQKKFLNHLTLRTRGCNFC